jgi:ABC-2 type transport system ATP-binding protein
MSEGEYIIEVENLVKKFGDFAANDNLSFRVRRGEVFGFLGPNGAGKTTAIKILAGLLSPTSGKISVAGWDIYEDAEKIKKNIGYMSQKFSLYEDLSVFENIRFYGGIYGMNMREIRKRGDELLSELQLSGIKNRRVAGIPLGWRQKVALCVAILHDPPILFLDEPTSGVDPVTRRQFWDMIYRIAADDKTVFVTTHYMDEAEYCGRVTIMVEGRIRALDTPANLKEEFGGEDMNEVFVRAVKE